MDIYVYDVCKDGGLGYGIRKVLQGNNPQAGTANSRPYHTAWLCKNDYTLGKPSVDNGYFVCSCKGIV